MGLDELLHVGAHRNDPQPVDPRRIERLAHDDPGETAATEGLADLGVEEDALPLVVKELGEPGHLAVVGNLEAVGLGLAAHDGRHDPQSASWPIRPAEAYGGFMALRYYTTVIDCHDIAAQARWWAQTLGWRIVYEDEHEVAVIPTWLTEDQIADLDTWMQLSQGLVFVPVPEGKQVKNRLHIDLAPHIDQDRDAEIAALIERGATRIDVGQHEDVTWTVLADPEGNEFCVLSSRDR